MVFASSSVLTDYTTLPRAQSGKTGLRILLSNVYMYNDSVCELLMCLSTVC